MLGDFFEPLPWNVPAAGDVFQKWHDIVHALGAAERENEERIVRARGIVEERRARSGRQARSSATPESCPWRPAVQGSSAGDDAGTIDI